MGQTLGELFRAFRTQRHISMKQAATGLNTATISRFERGQGDISLKIAGQLMFNIGMGVDDLGEMLGAQTQGFPNGLQEIIKGQRTALATKVDNFLQQQTCAEPLAALIRQIQPFLRLPETEDRHLPLTLEQALADRLAYPSKWSNFELYLISSAVPFASHELTTLLWQRLTALTGQTLGYQRQALWRLTLVALLHDDEPLYAQIAVDMQRISPIPALQIHFNSVMPQFLAISAIAEHRDPAPILGALRRVGATQLAAFLDHSVQTAGAKPAWHNQVIEDHYDSALAIDPDAKLMFGPTLARLRKQRGLTVKDVIGDWSAAAQSRFENGKTTLGFHSTLTLMQRLLVPTSQMQAATDATSTFRRYRLKAYTMASNFQQAHYTRDDLVNLLEEFRRTTPNFPEGLRVMYQGGLTTAFHWAAPDALPDHDPLYADATPSEQKAIVDYFRSLTTLSSQDMELLNLNINRIDQTYYDELVTVVLARIKPQSNVAAQLFDNCDNFIYGAVYFHVDSVIPKLTAAFTHESWLLSWWPICEVTELQTVAQVYQHDTEATRQAAAQLIADTRTLCPFDNTANYSEHWLTAYRGQGRQH